MMDDARTDLDLSILNYKEHRIGSDKRDGAGVVCVRLCVCVRTYVCIRKWNTVQNTKQRENLNCLTIRGE